MDIYVVGMIVVGACMVLTLVVGFFSVRDAEKV
jgi:hypothetical protein